MITYKGYSINASESIFGVPGYRITRPGAAMFTVCMWSKKDAQAWVRRDLKKRADDTPKAS